MRVGARKDSPSLYLKGEKYRVPAERRVRKVKYMVCAVCVCVCVCVCVYVCVCVRVGSGVGGRLGTESTVDAFVPE